MSVTPLPFSAFVDTTDSEQRWQIYSAIVGPGGVGENVVVTNFPATQTVSGTVEITNDVGNPIPVSGTIVPTSSAGTLISGTVTGVTVILAAGSRKYLAIQNTGLLNPMYITTDGTTPSATNGFVIQPYGGGFVWENSWVPNGVITAFSTSTTSTLIWV